MDLDKEHYSAVGDSKPIPTDRSFNHLLSLLVDRSWRRALAVELRKDYMHNIVIFLEKEKAKGSTIFPPRELIFNAFNLTPLNQIRVVLIGQDPYHGVGQAHGLCFSVNKGVRPPPSLLNMYKELKNDIPSFKIPNHGCLVSWAQQGVFMLNATLTVEAHKANSHSNIGWQKFTDEVIRIISRETKGVVFLLWGGFAHKKEVLVDRKKHAVIKTAHPSPLSAKLFLGCRCFSRTNEALSRMGRPPIDWKAL
uniref:Uracil-DNA glycosylase n=1 Tax=Syphacia muris TaxID=451379 RepID=A0A0N5AJY6_9BILA